MVELVAVDLLEVARCRNDLWSRTLGLGACLMGAFGCAENHALQHCSMVKAAVFQHPAFDLAGTTSLPSFVSCYRCDCKGGEKYVRDDNNDIVGIDEDLLCRHCKGSCWCEQRFWNQFAEDGDGKLKGEELKEEDE